MMLFRNPEIRRGLVLWGSAWVAATAAGCWISWPTGLWTAIVGLLFLLLHLGITRRRYRRIAELSRELDRILHGGGQVDLARFQEGELAILQSEIQKMTVRLRSQADALQKDKAFLADSLADISHQIRTPLTSLQLIASMLAEEELPEQRRLELVRELHSLLRRMDWLIETLLKLSRLDAGTVELATAEVPVARLLELAAAPLAVPMELREQQLTVQADGEYFLGDLAWSVEAVGNILKNCMEHTPPGGEIRVTVQQTPIFTEIVIADSGPGIGPEDLPHLFERFYKGKNAAPTSVGIGLALANGIVTAQNGTLSAGNGREGGAEFVIRFYSRTV